MSSKTTKNSSHDDLQSEHDQGESADAPGGKRVSWEARRAALSAKYSDELGAARSMSPEELRRLRRRISNRESARRLRKQRSEKLDELQEQQDNLEDQFQALSDQIMSATLRLQQLEAENSAMQLQLGEQAPTTDASAPLPGAKRSADVAGLVVPACQPEALTPPFSNGLLSDMAPSCASHAAASRAGGRPDASLVAAASITDAHSAALLPSITLAASGSTTGPPSLLGLGSSSLPTISEEHAPPQLPAASADASAAAMRGRGGAADGAAVASDLVAAVQQALPRALGCDSCTGLAQAEGSLGGRGAGPADAAGLTRSVVSVQRSVA